MTELRSITMPSLRSVADHANTLTRSQWEALGRVCAWIEKEGARTLSGSWKGRRFESDSPSQVRAEIERFIWDKLVAERLPGDSFVVQAVLVPNREEPYSLANWRVVLWARRKGRDELSEDDADHRPTIAERVPQERSAGREWCPPGCRCGVDRSCPGWGG